MFRRVLSTVVSKWKVGLFATAALVGLSLTAGNASAGDWGCGVGSSRYGVYGNYGGYGNYGNLGIGYGSYSGYRSYNSYYHGPSVHYDRVFHGYSHWTPTRGYHSHGHYHTVPHYVPGHWHHD